MPEPTESVRERLVAIAVASARDPRSHRTTAPHWWRTRLGRRPDPTPEHRLFALIQQPAWRAASPELHESAEKVYTEIVGYRSMAELARRHSRERRVSPPVRERFAALLPEITAEIEKQLDRLAELTTEILRGGA